MHTTVAASGAYCKVSSLWPRLLHVRLCLALSTRQSGCGAGWLTQQEPTVALPRSSKSVRLERRSVRDARASKMASSRCFPFFTVRK
ncbi:hypothetical protein BaRGS_00012544 [Batillaria attramentaria]|uniref:Secreted protein n=1 Tax=Batillaria attramentaria TaxID=370345 RepID=A0ABD0LAH4_9CAEN